ncbi:tyrosine-type recombinase/integrase [Specibacter sp. RAF43]|uniref:tyrosine-type recombinase/integrase n=1 Tax=Specibacter sp. RAF43 TaxID=3233057 RepID=UPI003F9AABEA
MGRPKTPAWQLGTITTTKDASGRWEARAYYRDDAGDRRQMRRAGRTKAAAENALKAGVREEELAARDAVERAAEEAAAAARLTVAELAAAWLEMRKPAPVVVDEVARTATLTTDGLRPQTWEQYRRVLGFHVLPAIGELQVVDVTTPVCEKAITGMYSVSTGAGYRTAALAKQVLQQLMDYAVRQGYREYNPAKSVSRVPKKRKKPQALALETVAAIQRAVAPLNPESGDNRRVPVGRTYDTVLLLRLTGLRIGEALGLRWEDVDTSSSPMTITVSGTLVERPTIFYRQMYPKTADSIRILPVTDPELVEMIGRRWRNRKTTPTNAVFAAARSGNFVRPSNLRTSLRKAQLEAGIEGRISPHSFRRTVGSGISAKYGDEAASHMLGHSSPDTTREYYIARPTVVPDYSDALRPPRTS